MFCSSPIFVSLSLSHALGSERCWYLAVSGKSLSTGLIKAVAVAAAEAEAAAHTGAGAAHSTVTLKR